MYTIMRHIEIDAAHRVPEHGSGCRNLHGHRYKIEAHCQGTLAETGEQSGMVLDFKFLKEEMVSIIHDNCDHGMILRWDDPLVTKLRMDPGVPMHAEQFEYSGGNDGIKLYLIGDTPTAENLARHWALRLSPRIERRSNGLAILKKVLVWETPNCYATYEL